MVCDLDEPLLEPIDNVGKCHVLDIHCSVEIVNQDGAIDRLVLAAMLCWTVSRRAESLHLRHFRLGYLIYLSLVSVNKEVEGGCSPVALTDQRESNVPAPKSGCCDVSENPKMPVHKPPRLGICPFCHADIASYDVLIEYETSDGTPEVWAECSNCREVIHPK